jgi:hypothetical protein
LNNGGPAPAIDLDDFNRRAFRIYEERIKAREEAEACGIAEAEAEHSYLKKRAQRLSHYRIKEQMGVTEALAMAEGDAADYRRERDVQQVLKKAAWARVEELEGNRAMLRQAAAMSEGLT